MKNAMQLKAKIKALAKENNVPAQAVMQNYLFERLLERISLSQYKDMFILKGEMLIASIVGIDNRTTMDMDATIVFSLNGLELIREDDVYGGYRASLEAVYDTIKTPLKIDITTGDAITPKETLYTILEEILVDNNMNQ